MERFLEPRALLAAALWAIVAAWSARELGIVVAAGALVAATGWTLWHRRSGPWLLAVPAALAAVELPEAAAHWPRAGPVRFEAEVLAGIRVDPVAGETRLRLRPLGPVDRRVTCLVRGVIDVLPGDRVIGLARVPTRPNRRDATPTLYTVAGALRVATRGRPSFARGTEACRLALQRALLAAIGGENGILLCHLVLGQGPVMPADLVASHRESGLSHLLAVSGAHASMLGWLLGAFYAVATGRSPLASRRYRRWCAAFLLVYGGVTGMEPPVFRALVAFFVVMFAHARGRRVPICAALALPALLTAVCAPRDLLTASFCLSYAAVFGLSLAGVFDARSWRQRYLMMPLLGSLWATLLTMPLTLHYFGQVAPWTIAATPLLAPLVATMLATGLVVALTAQVSSGLALGLAAPLDAMTGVYCAAVRVVAELPLTPVLAISRPDPVILGACGLLGVTLCVVRPGRATVGLLCVCLSAPYFVPARPAPPRLELLAVGHGQACLAHLPGGTVVLVDCGRLGDGRSPAAATARALLPRCSLDLLVLTHAHHDHVGGALPLLGRVRIAQVALPAEMVDTPVGRQLSARGVELIPIAAGQALELRPGVHAARPTTSSTDPNDGSIWVRLQLDAFSALVTGDALEAGVDAWLASAWAAPADVLVLPHHGRANARVAALLAVVRPDLALVSNRTVPGWSAQGRVAREHGIRVLETGRVGTIRIEASPPVQLTTEAPLRLR